MFNMITLNFNSKQILHENANKVGLVKIRSAHKEIQGNNTLVNSDIVPLI